jgi:hypothetical protein
MAQWIRNEPPGFSKSWNFYRSVDANFSRKILHRGVCYWIPLYNQGKEENTNGYLQNRHKPVLLQFGLQVYSISEEHTNTVLVEEF